MKNVIGALTLAFLIGQGVSASDEAIKKEVLAMNKALVNAQNACDIAAFERMTAYDFEYVTSAAKRMTRAEIVAVERKCAHRGSSITEEHVRVFGDDAAVLI